MSIKEMMDKEYYMVDCYDFIITNLQKENENLLYEINGYLKEKEKLKESIKEYQEELKKADSITQSCIFEGSRSAGKSYRQCLSWLEDYKQRNEKAVEYIKQHCDRPGRLLLPKIDFNYNDLLNILQGGDE